MSFSIDRLSKFDSEKYNLSNLNLKKDETIDFESVLDNVTSNKNEEDMKAAAKEFETYFINMMFKQMRNTINYSNGIFKRSKAEEIFQEMLDENIAKSSSEMGGIGLADSIYKQLSKDIKNDNKIDELE